MSKFKIGDKVRIVGPDKLLRHSGFSESKIDVIGGTDLIGVENWGIYFPESSLELIESEKPTGKWRIKTLEEFGGEKPEDWNKLPDEYFGKIIDETFSEYEESWTGSSWAYQRDAWTFKRDWLVPADKPKRISGTVKSVTFDGAVFPSAASILFGEIDDTPKKRKKKDSFKIKLIDKPKIKLNQYN